MPVMSASWNASVPMAPVATCPAKTMIGVPSIRASCIGVTVLVAPGPDVTSTMPGLPVTRAYPSAMCPAPCSCRARMKLKCLLSWIASNTGRIAPPGYPKIVSTPCSFIIA